MKGSSPRQLLHTRKNRAENMAEGLHQYQVTKSLTYCLLVVAITRLIVNAAKVLADHKTGMLFIVQQSSVVTLLLFS